MIDARAGRREARTKGMNFRAFLGSLARIRSKDAVEATLDAAPKEVRDAIRFGQIIASGWYPVGWYRELYLAAQRALNLGIELPREVGRDSTTHDFNSVFRLALRLVSVETAFGQAHRIVMLYYDGGSVETLGVRPGVGSWPHRHSIPRWAAPAAHRTSNPDRTPHPAPAASPPRARSPRPRQ